MDEDIAKLGALTRDENGYIDFEYVIKIYEISSYYAKTAFSQKKKGYLEQRRKVKNDTDKYKEIVMQMTNEEEMIIQDKLQEIARKAGITDEEFQRNAMYHAQDQTKNVRIMHMQKEIQSSGKHKVLSREKAIETFKAQQEVQMQQMEKMMSDPSIHSMTNQMTESDQMQLMMVAMIEQCRS